MKSHLHKIRKFVLATMLFGLGTFSAHDAEASSVIGHTSYTDIVASINSYNIESYNINGYTAVVAEDLRNYGFDVEWVQDERALYITRNNFQVVESTYIAPTIPKSQVGRKAFDIFGTDIKTYINGNLVTSYNINGRTIVYFDDLGVFGNVTYDDSLRLLYLAINDGLQYKLGNPWDNDMYFTRDSANGVCFYIRAENNTHKTIKYFNVDFQMLNSVFDPEYTPSGIDKFKIRIIGPMYENKYIANAGPTQGVDCYASEFLHYIYVPSIFVEYMDGTSETVYYFGFGTEREESTSSAGYTGYNL